VVASESSIIEGIDKAYGTSKEEELEQVMQSMNDLGEAADVEVQAEEQQMELAELERAADEAPIVKLVNLVLTDASSAAPATSTWNPTRRSSASASVLTVCCNPL